MYTTIIRGHWLAASVVCVAIAMGVSQAKADELKSACEAIGAAAQELAEMRDIGMEMTDAMNLFIGLNEVQEDLALRYVYALATSADGKPEDLPHDVGYTVFVACMEEAQRP